MSRFLEFIFISVTQCNLRNSSLRKSLYICPFLQSFPTINMWKFVYLSIELSTYSVQEKTGKLSTNYISCKVAVTSIKSYAHMSKCNFLFEVYLPTLGEHSTLQTFYFSARY